MKVRLLLGAAALAAAIYTVIAVYGADQVTRRRRKLCDTDPDSIARDWETVQFQSRDGLALKGWWFPPSAADRALILVHGHGQNRIDRNWGSDRIAREFLARGYGVLVFDLRGHGASAPSRQHFGVREKDDVLGAFELVKSYGFEPGSIALIGISYGAASLLLAAAEMPDAGAIVADSAYAEIWPVITAEIPRQRPELRRLRPEHGIRLAARLLHGVDLNRATPLHAVRRIEQPLLFIHGADDTYVPPEHSQRLHAAARHPASVLWLVSGAGHAETYQTAPDEFIARVAAFFDEQMPRRETRR